MLDSSSVALADDVDMDSLVSGQGRQNRSAEEDDGAVSGIEWTPRGWLCRLSASTVPIPSRLLSATSHL
jgi:hypothetical protein